MTRSEKIIGTVIVLWGVALLGGFLYTESISISIGGQNAKLRNNPYAKPLEKHSIKYIVTNNADSGEGTLRAGIESGATDIFFDSSMTIKLNSTIEIKKDIAIYGKTQKGKKLDITLEGSGDPENPFPILNTDFDAENVTIENITFTKGYAKQGGAINFTGGWLSSMFKPWSLTIKNCNFISNSAEWGGGAIFVNSHILTITNCTFTENSAHERGGVILAESAVLSITNSTFTSNSVQENGGVVWTYSYAEITIADSIFASNKAPGDEVIFVSDPDKLIIKNSNFTSKNNR